PCGPGQGSFGKKALHVPSRFIDVARQYPSTPTPLAANYALPVIKRCTAIIAPSDRRLGRRAHDSTLFRFRQFHREVLTPHDDGLRFERGGRKRLLISIRGPIDAVSADTQAL